MEPAPGFKNNSDVHLRDDLSQLSVQDLVKRLAESFPPPRAAGEKGLEEWMAERKAIRQQILALGAAAVEPLIAMIASPDKTVATVAVSLLGTLKDPRAVDPFLEILADGSGLLKVFAITALGRIGDARAIEALTATLEHPKLGTLAAHSLSQIGDPRGIDVLASWLEDPKIGKYAASGLAQSGDAGVPHLLRAADSANPEIRLAALQGLRFAKHPEVTERFIRTLDDPDLRPRWIALITLAGCDDPRASNPLRSAAARHVESLDPFSSLAAPDCGSEWTRAGMPCLIRFTARAAESLSPLHQEVHRLGRHQECETAASDPMVSRFHARIFCEAGWCSIQGWDWVHDKAPTNGLYLNGVRVDGKDRYRLHHGDVVMAGSTLFHFQRLGKSEVPDEL